jgi:hypothetical protein
MPGDTLLLRLKRKWFDSIAAGYKTEEYRKCTEYWRSRIENHSHHSICFYNGYGQLRPSLMVQYLGWDTRLVNDEPHYVLKLGAVLSMDNYALPRHLPRPERCEEIQYDDSKLIFNASTNMWMPLLRFPDISLVSVDEALLHLTSITHDVQLEVPVQVVPPTVPLPVKLG